MVSSEEYHSSSTAPTGFGECNSRFSIQASLRQDRLDAGPRDIPMHQQSHGPHTGGSLCYSLHSTSSTDSEAEATDAFQQIWSTRLGFAHPPWCLIARTLAKILREEATSIIVTPIWHTQAWFPTLLEMLVNYPPLLGIKFSADVAEVQCKGLSNTARPGQEKIFQAVTISCFKEDTSLCPVSCLIAYEKGITTLRGDTGQLFLSSVAPHRPVSSSTISRCSTEFTAHSTRAAFSTAAALNGVSIREVMERACWSNEDTFCKYYCRPSAQAKLATIMGHQSSHK